LGSPERWKRCSPLPADIEERLESLAPLLEKRGVLLAYLFGPLAAKDEKSPAAARRCGFSCAQERGGGLGATGGAG